MRGQLVSSDTVVQAKNRDNSFFIAPPSKWAERGVEQYVAHHLFLNMIQLRFRRSKEKSAVRFLVLRENALRLKFYGPDAPAVFLLITDTGK